MKLQHARRGLALALLVPLVSSLAAGQHWSRVSAEFQEIQGTDFAPNGDAVLAALWHVQRIDPNGATVYSLDRWPLAAEDARVRADGRTFVVGFDDSGKEAMAHVGALDASGQSIWEQRWELGDGSHTWFSSLRVTSDGGVVAVGTRLDLGWNGSLVVHRFDGDGNLLWARQFTDNGVLFPTEGWDVEEFGDGSLLVYGRSDDDITFESVLVRLTSTGSFIWARQIPVQTARGELARLTSGDILVVAPQVPPLLASVFLRVDASGNVVWQRSYPVDQAEFTTRVRGTSDGGAVFAGALSSVATQSLRVGKIDAGGELEWQRHYGDGHLQLVDHVAVAGDGTVLATGTTVQQIWRNWHLRLDASGVAGSCAGVLRAPVSEITGLTLELTSEQIFDPGGLFTPSTTTAIPAALVLTDHCITPDVGTRDCSPAVPNSSGLAARITAVGFDLLLANDLTLVAENLPASQFGYFLAGQGNAVSMPPGTQGNLCLGGATIHRYAKSVLSSGSAGMFELAIDVNAVPGHGPIVAGETWRFQAWFRDVNPTPTSNFTDVAEVTFF